MALRTYFCTSDEVLDDDALVPITAQNMEHAACKFGLWAQNNGFLSTAKISPVRVAVRESEEVPPVYISITWYGTYFVGTFIRGEDFDE